MQTEDFTFNNGSDGQIVEEVGKHDPDSLATEFLLALLVETVDLGDPPGLVVASSEVDTLWVPDLKCDQE